MKVNAALIERLNVELLKICKVISTLGSWYVCIILAKAGVNSNRCRLFEGSFFWGGSI